MSLSFPYKRTIRPDVHGEYRFNYIHHRGYATSPQHFVQAYLLIQRDLLSIFEYIEPADQNENCYSHRIYELLFRTCVEVEANMAAIMKENGYPKAKPNMTDYILINQSHHLSSYEVTIPFWDGQHNIRTPFQGWTDSPLSWYQAYNKIKHDRTGKFKLANMGTLLDAICGLVVLLSSQFYIYPFPASNWFEWIREVGTEPRMAIGDYFSVKFPADWRNDECYDFDWEVLHKMPDPFINYPYC